MAAKGKKAANTVSLDAEEQAEISNRTALIEIHRRTTTLLESELRLFYNHLLTSKGLDPSKRYSLDPKSGALTEMTEDSSG